MGRAALARGMAASLTAAMLVSAAAAQEAATPAVTAISPIFGQLVAFTLPAGFKTVHEKPGPSNYIREAVKTGESVEKWTEMVTVTGVRGAAADPKLTPKDFVLRIGGGFQRACPDSFQGTLMGALSIDGHDAFAGIVRCGKSPSGPWSEAAMIVAIKGAADYYTVQHAERVALTETAKLDDKRWGERLRKLRPIRVCPIVPGERAPYPSCVGAAR